MGPDTKIQNFTEIRRVIRHSTRLGMVIINMYNILGQMTKFTEIIRKNRIFKKWAIFKK